MCPATKPHPAKRPETTGIDAVISLADNGSIDIVGNNEDERCGALAQRSFRLRCVNEPAREIDGLTKVAAPVPMHLARVHRDPDRKPGFNKLRYNLSDDPSLRNILEQHEQAVTAIHERATRLRSLLNNLVEPFANPEASRIRPRRRTHGIQSEDRPIHRLQSHSARL